MMLHPGKLLYLRTIFLLALVLFAGVQIWGFVSYATTYPVEPVSDFEDFWRAVGDLSLYVKGGLLIFLYWPLKAMGLPPGTCALILHIVCYLAALSTSVYFALFSNRPMLLFRIASLSLFLVWGMIWTPLTGTVEVMMIHTSFLLCGLHFLLLSDSRKVNVIGLLLLFGAFSMRAQAMFIFSIAIVVFHVLSLLLPVRRSFLYRIRLIIPCLLLAVVSETVLQHDSFRDLEAKNHQRTPFYAGFVMADPTDTFGCGNWSLEAAQTAWRDMDVPLVEIFLRALREKGLSHTVSISLCKIRRAVYIADSASAAWWTYSYYLEHTPNSPKIAPILEWNRRESICVKIYRGISLALLGALVVFAFIR